MLSGTSFSHYRITCCRGHHFPISYNMLSGTSFSHLDSTPVFVPCVVSLQDHLLRYEANPAVKILLLLGEVGGVDEYEVARLIKEGRITKPVVAWCIGTCAKCFATEVQFGHAGALARSNAETADAKNAMLRESGAHVPSSFDMLPDVIQAVYVD